MLLRVAALIFQMKYDAIPLHNYTTNELMMMFNHWLSPLSDDEYLPYHYNDIYAELTVRGCNVRYDAICANIINRHMKPVS